MSQRAFGRRGLGFEHLENRQMLSATPVDTLFVDDDGLDFANADYDNIQEAVDAADAGDRVVVAAGTYEEAVTIGEDKNGLELVSHQPFVAVIKAPAGTEVATVHVDGANDVLINAFTIHGTPGIVAGVYVGGNDVDGASAAISHNHIAVRDDTPLTGNQAGLGILVGQSSRIAGSSGAVGAATISHNSIDNYQKGGIVVNGSGSEAEIAHNEIVGTPATYLSGQAAQNGIQVSGGADANIHHNAVSNNNYLPNPAGTQWAASGILVYGGGDVSISHNVVTGGDSDADNNVGIYVILTDGVEVSHNKVHGNDYGIILYFVEDALVEHNSVKDSVYGIALFEVLESDLSHNRGKGNELDFYDNADEGENNWSKNKGDLLYG